MNDARAMAFRESLTGLENEIDGIFERQLPVRAAMQHPFQIDAVEVFHNQEWNSGRQRGYIDDANHVLISNLARRARLPQKACNRVRALLPGSQKLNCNSLL